MVVKVADYKCLDGLPSSLSRFYCGEDAPKKVSKKAAEAAAERLARKMAGL